MALTAEQAATLVGPLVKKLEQRADHYRRLDGYYDASRSPLPQVIRDAKLTNAYNRLMPLAEAPWGALVVDSVLDRLEVAGVRDTESNKATVDAVWGVWQDNQMDAESKLAHSSALISGRAFALVWPDEDGQPQISLDSSEQMVVQYQEGSRRHRVAALRQWCDEDRTDYATLYRREALYKFRKATEKDRRGGGTAPADWLPFQPPEDEAWPVANPFDVVPVLELAVNRRLKPGQWGHARGEYEHCLGLIDRINLLTFLGLVVAFWMGFPLRGVIGDKILRDDDDNPLPPFKSEPNEVALIENPNAKTFEYTAADRSNLAIYPELSQFAAITKTPRHYFPLAQAMANLSADAIRADEGALNAKVIDHKGSLGEGEEEMLRVAGLMLPNAVELSPKAELIWQDHESRSLAERADAAVKLNGTMPWQWIAENVLNLTQQEVARVSAQRSSDALAQVLTAAASTPTGATNGATPPVAAGGGGGPAGRETRPPRGNEPRV